MGPCIAGRGALPKPVLVAESEPRQTGPLKIKRDSPPPFSKTKLKCKKNKEKNKNAFFKIPNLPYPTHGGQPTDSQTCSESFHKFIVLRATDNRKLSNASPFLISKAVQGSAGVIYCPDLIPLPDSEIEEELASQGVEAVKRITSIKDSKTVISPLFILTFSKHTLPENILIGYLNIKIRPYIPNPLRCFRCQSYGHGTASCRGIATCNKCSSTEHASEACTTEWRKCANCKGEHAAYSKICTKWQQEKEIQRIKVLENLSYSEAKKQVVNILPPRASSSYANAVMTNTKSKKDTATQTDIGTQTEISNIETPTNIDNLTSESHKNSPIAQKPITNNLIEQETTLSPTETSFPDLESLNLDKRSPETLHLSVPSDTEVLMKIDKSSTKRPAPDNVQEATKILKPSIRIESGGIQTTKEVEDVMLLSKKGEIKTSTTPKSLKALHS
ncbi:uncharacterized protein TNIN_66841 [Trichonephila inaurata madagascariensis]|uniref:Gag-like protein n=1 Tax=Trichonephila inaurata madagascariensis TaxID=2747483 RepID=A0A8X7BUB0_9ARAC|nr:uncharacterized protein TNIN_66841 [Trichonephila inaurata madagascariensis]